jgi:hypothetical protein
MPYFAVVIKDAQVAHEQEIARTVEHNVKIHGEDARPRIEKHVRSFFAAPRPAGHLHAHVETECPDGLPNCRNCGDPVHAASCKAAGHCPHCGTLHGLAPDAHVTAHGYELVELDGPPKPDHVWNPSTKRFHPREA